MNMATIFVDFVEIPQFHHILQPKHDKDKNRMGHTFDVARYAEQALYMYLKYCDCTIAIRSTLLPPNEQSHNILTQMAKERNARAAIGL